MALSDGRSRINFFFFDGLLGDVVDAMEMKVVVDQFKLRYHSGKIKVFKPK